MRLVSVLACCFALACVDEVVSPVEGGAGGSGASGSGAAGAGGSGAGGAGTGASGGSASGGSASGGGGSGAAGAGGAGAAGGAGGSGGGPTGPIMVGSLVPDFSLVDVNTASPTSGQAVSPRDYLEQVSGWYFGHST